MNSPEPVDIAPVGLVALQRIRSGPAEHHAQRKVVQLCLNVDDLDIARAESAQFLAYWSGLAFIEARQFCQPIARARQACEIRDLEQVKKTSLMVSFDFVAAIATFVTVLVAPYRGVALYKGPFAALTASGNRTNSGCHVRARFSAQTT